MTKTAGICPICNGSFQWVARHLRDFHSVVNTAEARILNDISTGTCPIPPGQCPVQLCTARVKHVRKHFMRSHKALSSAAKKRHIIRGVPQSCRKLRATDPRPPLVSTLDLNGGADECPRVECQRTIEGLEQSLQQMEVK